MTKTDGNECLWTYFPEDFYYESECGANFVFNDGTVDDNGFIYCYKCGKQIKNETI